jgi:Ser/Thr protein kinase RdoA (MazF antagonist)
LIYGQTSLHRHAGFRFAVYPSQGGRPPELDDLDQLRWMGRFLARIHTVGASRAFAARPVLEPESFGAESRRYLLEQGLIPAHIETAYESLSRDLLDRIDARYRELGRLRYLRLHGDCHPGNVLWTDDGPHFVDLDDARMGPAIQDLWMLGSGNREEQIIKLGALLEGYTQFGEFDRRELGLIEPLRSLRIMHYAAWLARRWSDPAFPQAFPWFDSPRFWEDHVLSLREQLALLDEPVLEV